MKIVKAKDYTDMSRKAANILSAQVILFPESVLGLATGSTPIGMYQQLIQWHRKGDIDFSSVRTVNLDEYIGLSGNNRHSYRYFMKQSFFKHVNIRPERIMIPNGLTADVESECIRYENSIKGIGGIDLQVLGIGHNGHIGFNEPMPFFWRNTHKVKLSESTLAANSRFFDNTEDMPKCAISMGIGTIIRAKRILLMCSGEEKAQILYRSLFGDIDPMVPASALQLHSNVTVVADRDALSVITDKFD